MNGERSGTKGRVYAFETIEDFLAHAVALESEVADRYLDLAQSMEVHNNPGVAQVFQRLARASAKHAGEMRLRAENNELPQVAPWEFEWGGGEAPETPSMDGTHYLMTPYQALELARTAEIEAQNFYTAVAENSQNPIVKKMAFEFAYEEAEHVHLVNEWIATCPQPPEGWDFDPDPPAITE